MSPRVERVLLGIIALGGAWVGAWALLAPRSFYDGFPGGGRAWVSPDGPYNQHLIGDVGALNLALVAITVLAAAALVPAMTRAVAVGWLVYSVPHLLYHATHLDPFVASDQIAIVAGLLPNVVVPVALLVLGMRRQGDAAAHERETEPGAALPT